MVNARADGKPSFHLRYFSRIRGFAASFNCKVQLDVEISMLNFYKFPGGLTAGVTPVPIPNTEVKLRRADNTARVTVRERRSPPGLKFLNAGSEQIVWSLFCFRQPIRDRQDESLLDSCGMTRKLETGTCEHCGKEFGYYLVHNGFNDSAYAYCDSCSYSVDLSGWSKLPPGVRLQIHKKISEDIEPFLKPCPCGGSFRADAVPRCPHCRRAISPIFATTYIEKNVVGTAKGWQWQKNWDDLYSIVIENLCVRDGWKDEQSS